MKTFQLYADHGGMSHPVLFRDGEPTLGAMGRSPDVLTETQKDAALRRFPKATVFDVDRDLNGIPVVD